MVPANICICSNDANTLATMQRLITQQMKWESTEILFFSNIATCLTEINRTVPDIAVIDTALPDGNGIDLALEFAARSLRCQIIFISDGLEMALDVYKVDHVAFIVKAQIPERMPFFLQKCYDKIQQDKISMCVFKNKNEQRIFPQKDILYVESNHRVLGITTFSRKEFVYGTLSEMLEKLNPHYFAQCHKSYLVNLEHLIGISSDEAEFCTGDRVPVSRLYRKSFLEKYDRFIAQKSIPSP